ncbi:hypothetical protein GF362_03805 [Candidatus Dojkabacteria bacterium]|nr:hypothetical protein [Candidatus Dojkabacteria bacterium]
MMKLITLNCQRAYRKKSISKYLQSVIEKTEHDFICLQEVNSEMRAILKQLIQSSKKYQLLDSKDVQNGKITESAIIYLNKYKIRDQGVLSFLKKQHKDSKAHGLLYGVFKYKDKTFWIGSIHLPAGIKIFQRIKALKNTMVLLRTLEEIKSTIKIIGGDFNTGWFEDILFQDKILKPEFKRFSDYQSGSFSSKYLEDTSLMYKIYGYLGKLNIYVSFKTDKFYIDLNSYGQYKTKVKNIDVVVSDHRPIELILK